MSNLPPKPFENADHEETLIFFWQGRPRKVWRLSVILLGSLLAHAAMFYLLQVAYVPTASLEPPAAQVMLIAPEDPAQKAAFDQWLQMADPALMTAPPGNEAAGVIDQIGLSYKPSYAGAPPGFKSLEPAARDAMLAIPERSLPPGPIPFVPDEIAVARPIRGETVPSPLTKLVFRGLAESFVATALPPLKFTASQNSRPLEPTVYLVGVRPGGGKAWLFRQPAAGETATADPGLEAQAYEYLSKVEFQRRAAESADVSREVTWGWATFYWGREVYH